VTLYRFTVSYEDTIEAPDPALARTWALEEVEAGHYRPVFAEVEPVTRKDTENGD
jgi:hypothetical protein